MRLKVQSVVLYANTLKDQVAQCNTIEEIDNQEEDYMVPLKSWIEKLILRCAKKDEINKFIKEQQVEKKVNIVNSDVATNSVPTPNTTGVLGSVDFKDSRDALIAALEAYRTPMEGKGIRLRINDNYLGFRVSDEGIPTSYVNHPNPDGPANQIATMKYVADWGNALQSALNGLDNLSQNCKFT